MRIVVMGGSIAGLGAALALSRDGHEVTVLEQDATPLPASPLEAFEHWERRGAPQVRHSHAFLARLRNLLRDRAPDLLAALLASGAEELDFGRLLPPAVADRAPRPGDEDLVMLACRRITFEWVLRRTILDDGRAAFLDDAEVRGLQASPGDPPRVTGVALRRHGQDEVLPADLAIDATGRRSALPRWLEGIGAPRPGEESEDSGIFYCSRFYRLREGAEPPQRETTIGADLGYLKYAIFHGDSGIFSITFAASPEDAPLRALLRLGPFEAATRVLPPMAGWVDPAVAEPITNVHGMANLRNTRRFTIRDGQPLALGVIPIGDASIHTNPLYGRGCTFALVHAYLLADAVREHPDDLRALALAVEAATEREIVPTYAMTVTQDRDARDVAAVYARGEEPTEQPAGDGPVDPKAYMRSLLRHGLLPAVRSDPDVSRTFFRGFNLLTPAADLMKDPLVLGKVLEFYQHRHERQEPSMGPRRPEMLPLLEAAS